MNRAAEVAALGVLALLAGCAAAPRLDYHALADRPRRDNWVAYALTDTIVTIGTKAPPGDGKAGQPPISLAERPLQCDAGGGCGKTLAAVAVPTDFAGEVLALEPRSRNLVSTAIAPTYVGDSLRLRKLTVEARDHRIEAINAIGAIAVGTAKLVGGDRSGGQATAAPPTLYLPVLLTLAQAKAAIGKSLPLPGQEGWTYAAAFRDDPAAAGFLPRRARTTIHEAFVTSVCRPLHLTLTGGGGVPISFDVTVADPDWLMTIPLPAKGAIVPHALCGADVETEAVTTVGVDAIAEAFFAQVGALQAALK